MKKVYVHHDEQSCIVLTKDHHNGICIQLGVYTDQMVPNVDNLLIMSRNLKVVDSTVINTSTPNFKQAISEKVKELQHKVVLIQESHKILDGVLNDYHSQNRDINEPAKQ